jgi:Transposase DDE domain group 1
MRTMATSSPYGRGTAEQHIKKGRTRFAGGGYPATLRHNTVRLQLHVVAYNLATSRRLALPEGVEHWSQTTLREKLVKIGARIVRHGRYVAFQLAEVAVPRALFAEILRRIDSSPPGSVSGDSYYRWYCCHSWIFTHPLVRIKPRTS